MSFFSDDQGREWVSVGGPAKCFIYLDSDKSSWGILKERENKKDVYWVGDIKSFETPARISGPFDRLDEAKTAYLMLYTTGEPNGDTHV